MDDSQLYPALPFPSSFYHDLPSTAVPWAVLPRSSLTCIALPYTASLPCLVPRLALLCLALPLLALYWAGSSSLVLPYSSSPCHATPPYQTALRVPTLHCLFAFLAFSCTTNFRPALPAPLTFYRAAPLRPAVPNHALSYSLSCPSSPYYALPLLSQPCFSCSAGAALLCFPIGLAFMKRKIKILCIFKTIVGSKHSAVLAQQPAIPDSNNIV